MSSEQFELLISGFKEMQSDIKEMKVLLSRDMTRSVSNENRIKVVEVRSGLAEQRLANIEPVVAVDNAHLVYDPEKHQPA